MHSLLYIFLLLISPDLFAGVFDPPPNDKSVEMLGMIFGSNIGNIPLGGAVNPVLSGLMEKFNFIIVSVGTIIVSYVAIMSTINTAQEGSAMGKKWSAIWIPMRSIAGMALMIPSPASGYSMIQVTVMWIILQGIGAADQIWNIALEGLSHGASAMIGIKPDVTAFGGDANDIVPLILDAAICMEALNQFSTDANGDHVKNDDWLNKNGLFIKHYASDVTVSPLSEVSATVTGSSNFGVDDNSASPQPGTPKDARAICGSLAVTGTATAREYGDSGTPPTKEDLRKAAQLIYDTKQLAISTILTIMQPLAEGIVNGSVKIDNTDEAISGTTGYFANATEAYVSLMSGLIMPIEQNDAKLKTAIKSGEDKGWIVAGAYYFVFNTALQKKIYDSAQVESKMGDIQIPTCPLIAYAPMDSPVNACIKAGYTDKVGIVGQPLERFTEMFFPLSTRELQTFTNYLAQGNRFLVNEIKFSTNHDSLGFNPDIAKSSDPILTTFVNHTAVMANLLASMLKTPPGSDPLIVHAIFGRNLMVLVEHLWIALIVLTAGLAMGTAFVSMLTGLGAAIMTVVTTVLGALFPLLAIIWGMGAMLAIYAPLIPFMIFTSAALGWLLTVVEAIVGAPLIALGIVMPGGDELGKLETALMILANIFLKPMLMIFGFMLAGGVYKGVVSLIDLGMLEVFNTINVSTMFAWIPMFAAYIAFIISCENICFSLIHAVPDKILQWLGGPKSDTNVEAVSATKGITQGAATQTGQAGSTLSSEGGKASGGLIGAGGKSMMKKK